MPRPTLATPSREQLDHLPVHVGDRIAAHVLSVSAFLKRRPIELGIIVVALALRFSLIITYHPSLGYDADAHIVNIQWFAYHWSLPDIALSPVSYHPPLYYFIEGAFLRSVHGDVAIVALTSVIFSSATLLLIWAGFERHLPRQRVVRIVGLALAAILPAAMHLAGMASAEGLNGLLATAALLLTAEVLRRQRTGEPIIARAGLVGLLVGLEMLAKISALAILGTIGAAVVFEILFGKGAFGTRLRRTAPWLVAIAVFVAATGWYFSRNHFLYHKMLLSGFDGPDGGGVPTIEAPYFKRRPPDFFYGWSNDVLSFPYQPSGMSPRSHLWPVVVASTFADYYNYGFVGKAKAPPSYIANGRPLPERSRVFARLSTIGGTVIAASTAISWFWALIVCLRRRDSVRLLFLLAPVAALAGLLHFVIEYPIDGAGLVKGVYLQFAMGPLFAVFGLAVAKTTRRRATWPLAIVQCAAILAVASYTIYARVFAF